MRINLGPLEFSAFKTRPPRSAPSPIGWTLQVGWQWDLSWHLLVALDYPWHWYLRGFSKDSVQRIEDL